MPLTAAITTPIFTADLFANLIIGISAPQFAYGVASGLETYAGSGLTVETVDVGTLGVGVGLGSGIIIALPILIAAFAESFAANGLLGIMSPPMINALSLGFATALAQAEIQTLNPSVGVGAGAATLVPNSGASLSAWKEGFAAANMNGPNIQQMIAAISQGFDTAAPSGIGVVAIVGPPNIVPAAGIGTGSLI